MKLISNTSFGELCKSKENEFSRRIDYLDWFERVRNNFDNFLKQPLKLEMFVPCDEDGNVLEEYKRSEAEILADKNSYCRYISKEEAKWNKAKEKVLFEGFKVIKLDNITITIEYDHFQLDYNKVLNVFANHRTIEDLAKYNLIELTENAI